MDLYLSFFGIGIMVAVLLVSLPMAKDLCEWKVPWWPLVAIPVFLGGACISLIGLLI